MNLGRFTVRGRAHGYEGNPGCARMEGRPLREDEPGLAAYTSRCGRGKRAAHRVSSKRPTGSIYREYRGMGWTAWADAARRPRTDTGTA